MNNYLYPPYNNPGAQWYPSNYNTATPSYKNESGIIWVQGEAGAKAHPVNPNCSVILMDSENSCFYIKSADASGMPLPLRTFDYTERPVIDPSTLIATENPDYATTEYIDRKFDEFSKKFMKMIGVDE